MTGLHENIQLSFMVVGHTRCLGCFGLIKRNCEWRGTRNQSSLPYIPSNLQNLTSFYYQSCWSRAREETLSLYINTCMNTCGNHIKILHILTLCSNVCIYTCTCTCTSNSLCDFSFQWLLYCGVCTSVYK